jgi:hypothetical protein
VSISEPAADAVFAEEGERRSGLDLVPLLREGA